jgi:hypothetical protein
MRGMFDSAGSYAAEVQVAVVRSRGIVYFVALGWLVMPWIFQSLVFPGDAIRVQAYLMGLPKPEHLTAQQLIAGLIDTLFVLAAVVAFQYIGTLHFYRRAQISGNTAARPALWPIAAISTGLIGNAIWFVVLGGIDLEGALMGFMPALFTITVEMFLEKAGTNQLASWYA